MRDVQKKLQAPALLLLDAGNTLVFLDHAALSEAAAQADVHVTGDALLRAEPEAKRRYEAAMARGVSHEDGWTLQMQAIFEAAGVSSPQAGQAAEAARREHERFNLWRKVPHDLPAALDSALAAGIRLGVVSNSEGKLDELFARVGLTRFFERVIDSAFEGVRKPDPEIFRRALSRFEIAAEQAFYAGDIPRVDVDGARDVGMRAALIDALDHYPDYTDAPKFHSVCELVRAFTAP